MYPIDLSYNQTSKILVYTRIEQTLITHQIANNSSNCSLALSARGAFIFFREYNLSTKILNRFEQISLHRAILSGTIAEAFLIMLNLNGVFFR